MQQVQKKLREARFFLGCMHDRGSKAFGDHEEFDFYLSAFLNAGRSVDWRLRHEQGTPYEHFRKIWDAALPASDSKLVKCLIDDRNLEVHESGSSRSESETRIPVFGSYSDESGTVTITAPPGTPLSEICRPTYSFTIDGQHVDVIEACRSYIALLDRLVSDYCNAQGIV